MTSQAHQHVPQIVARNIRAGRDAAGLTQRELALILDVDKLAIHRWERAGVIPSVTNLTALAVALDREPGWFYVDHEPQEISA